MIKCPQCGKEFEEDSLFCDECGAKLEKKIFCQECGVQVSDEDAFCQNCGASLQLKAEPIKSTPTVAAPIEVTVPPETKKPFRLSKRLIAIGIAAIALITAGAVAITVLPNIFGGGKRNYALYIKDGELFYMDIDDREPIEITDNLFYKNMKDEDILEAGYTLSYYTQVSKDGDTIFYIDKTDEDESGVNIYYRSLDDVEQEPVKIDSDIRGYGINDDANMVTYLKGDDLDLYQHNLIDKEKIANDVRMFRVSDDGNQVLFVNKENTMYLKSLDEDKEKIDIDVSSIDYIDEDFETVYYTKDDNLYKKTFGRDKVKIASDIKYILSIYDSGEIYYVKGEEKELSLKDYVIDDKKKADAKLTMPTSPEYPSRYDFYGYYEEYDDYYDDYYTEYGFDEDAYDEAYEQYQKDYTEYEKKRDEYYEKQERDRIRERLEDRTIENTVKSLYYYDGKTEKLLKDNFGEYKDIASDAAVAVFSVYNQAKIEKVKLSQIDSVSDLEDKVTEALYSNEDRCIAVGDTVSVIKEENAENFYITSDGKAVYFIDNIEEYNDNNNYRSFGDAYKIEISDKKPGKPKLYDKDVSTYNAYLTTENQYVYFKDVEDGAGELYIDKKKIDFDVAVHRYNVLENGDVVYMTDWDDKKSHGTLKYFDGKRQKIDDDVYNYHLTPDDEILYLRDYSKKRYKGDLYIYDGRSEKIDQDVSAIVPVLEYGANYLGMYY